ncbi:site-specific integrase [Jannaschia sp. S6380]|uniref:site-specific integrase n=1 Tax=Jannaschia sp. S6380 TaxID=2926408 RepID=UPI001FF2069A|nr:site-specific integrase [Jannaschia sp. S6380]MCK0167275.1 site-specific integrase [Jannaschia sp. S6380]
MNGQLSRIEAQRFLSANVATETARLRAERYAEPLDMGPDEWLGRAMSERVRKAAAEIVSARGTAAVLLSEDEERLAGQGLGPAEIAEVPKAIAELVDWINDPAAADEVAQFGERMLGRRSRDARETRTLQCLHLSGQAKALGQMDRIKATEPLVVDLATAATSSATGPVVHLATAGPLHGHSTLATQARTHAEEPSYSVRTATSKVGSSRVADEPRKQASPTPAEQPTSPPKDLLSSLVEETVAKKYPKGRTTAAEKSIGKDRRQCRKVLFQFVVAVGDRPLSELRQMDVAHYVDLLACLPRIYGRSEADRQRSLRELVERAEDLPDDQIGLAAGMVNRNLGHIKRLLRYARSRGLHPAEPIELSDLRQKDRRDARSVREAFDAEDLARLARHSVWSGCKSEGRRHELGREIIWDGLYWGPLLAAYTGARREELMGLRVEEVRLDGQIPFLAVQLNVNRGLKNAAAVRDLPLHSRIMELGFADYVAGLKTRGEVDLFPELRPEADAESFGSNLYKKWKKAKDVAPGTRGERKMFHSFRHTVITHLRQETEVPKLAVTALVGHTPDGETDGRYTKRMPLEKVAVAVNALPRWF